MRRNAFYDADKDTEYFINPTIKEMDSIKSGFIRFTAIDDTKQVFVWDGDVRLHSSASKFLNIPKHIVSKSLTGVAEKLVGTRKYVMTNSDTIEVAIEEDPDAAILILSINWDWVNDYIYVTDYINILLDDIAKLYK